MLKLALTAAITGMSLLFAFSASAAPPDIASVDWSVKAPHNLAANRPSDGAIKAFMSELDGVPDQPDSICYAKFVDLRGSGTLSLVVSQSDGRFCHLNVVDKTAGGFDVYDFNFAHFVAAPEIKHLGGDGKLELIAPVDLTGYEGAQHCIAIWDVIYAWTGSDYTDVSSQYKHYYQEDLAWLQKDISRIEAQNERAQQALAAQRPGAAASAGSEPPSGLAFGPKPSYSEPPVVAKYHGPDGSATLFAPTVLAPPPQLEAPSHGDLMALDCEKAEAAKDERFLGNRDAGMSDAIKWKHSDNAYDREFAAWILADIGTPEATSDLQTLRYDSVRGVALAAKYSLQKASRGLKKYTVEHEFIPVVNGKPRPQP
ncbi:MAG TPA: hypothetical protein VMV15_15775 [Candidatus Binataceae bacterium]|nr:hypothetical protein [Candidatus Binataceae bacterium]